MCFYLCLKLATEVFIVNLSEQCTGDSQTLWVVSIAPWRRTPWMVGVLGEGTRGRKLTDQLRQPSASCALVSRLLNQYRNRIFGLWASLFYDAIKLMKEDFLETRRNQKFNCTHTQATRHM